MVEGSCLCGDVKYRVEIMQNKVFNCHCQYCRKAHGSAYATMAMAKVDSLVLIDDSGLLKEHKSGLGGFRAFCSHCGTRLMNYGPGDDKSGYLSVTLATVDSPVDYAPVAHANTESKASWCEPYAGIPNFSGMPSGDG